ncbi:MAG: type II secretion system protein GspG [Planctomycetota bacterium]
MSVDEENTDTRPPRQAKIGRIGWSALAVTVVLVVTLIVPNVLEKWRPAVLPKARVDIHAIVFALHEYAAQHDGHYPDTLDELVVPDASGDRYLQAQRVPLDPWKNPYNYEPPDPAVGRVAPHVWTNGSDGLPGGDDDFDSAALDE